MGQRLSLWAHKASWTNSPMATMSNWLILAQVLVWCLHFLIRPLETSKLGIWFFVVVNTSFVFSYYICFSFISLPLSYLYYLRALLLKFGWEWVYFKLWYLTLLLIGMSPYGIQTSKKDTSGFSIVLIVLLQS